MSKILMLGIGIVAVGLFIVMGAGILALASIPFGSGQMATPTGPIGKAAITGLVIAFVGLPVFVAGIVIQVRADT